MAIEKDVLDQLLAGGDPDEVLARGGLLDDLKKALSERILNAELNAHLDSERAEDLASAKPPAAGASGALCRGCRPVST